MLHFVFIFSAFHTLCMYFLLPSLLVRCSTDFVYIFLFRSLVPVSFDWLSDLFLGGAGFLKHFIIIFLLSETGILVELTIIG